MLAASEAVAAGCGGPAFLESLGDPKVRKLLAVPL